MSVVYMMTDTYNVPRFSSIAEPFDLGRKNIRKKLQKEVKDRKPLCFIYDSIWRLVKDLSELRQSKGQLIAHLDTDFYLFLFRN